LEGWLGAEIFVKNCGVKFAPLVLDLLGGFDLLVSLGKFLPGELPSVHLFFCDGLDNSFFVKETRSLEFESFLGVGTRSVWTGRGYLLVNLCGELDLDFFRWLGERSSEARAKLSF
jgi:hypothetical protein